MVTTQVLNRIPGWQRDSGSPAGRFRQPAGSAGRPIPTDRGRGEAGLAARPVGGDHMEQRCHSGSWPRGRSSGRRRRPVPDRSPRRLRPWRRRGVGPVEVHERAPGKVMRPDSHGKWEVAGARSTCVWEPCTAPQGHRLGGRTSSDRPRGPSLRGRPQAGAGAYIQTPGEHRSSHTFCSPDQFDRGCGFRTAASRLPKWTADGFLTAGRRYSAARAAPEGATSSRIQATPGLASHSRRNRPGTVGERHHVVERAGATRVPQGLDANVLVVAGVVDLIEL